MLGGREKNMSAGYPKLLVGVFGERNVEPEGSEVHVPMVVVKNVAYE